MLKAFVDKIQQEWSALGIFFKKTGKFRDEIGFAETFQLGDDLAPISVCG